MINVFGFIIIGFSAIGFLKTYKESDGVTNFAIFPLVFSTISANVLLDMGVQYIKDIAKAYWRSTFDIPIPGEVTACIALTCIAFVFFCASILVDVNDHPNIKKAIAIGGILFLFATEIISISDSSSLTTVQTICLVFDMIGYVVFIPFIIVSDSLCYYSAKIHYSHSAQVIEDRIDDDYLSKPKLNNSIKPTPVISNNDKNNVNAQEELRKLKKLLDENIITKEEYEEKRKKYVDML